MKRRVVVTGVGLVTPLGIGVAKTWGNICAGKSGVSLITRFDTSDYQVKIAAEIKDFNVEDFLDKKAAKHLDLFVQYGLAAAMMAVGDSGFEVNEANCGRVGVITGCGMGGLPTIEKYHQVCLEKGPKKITPFFIPMVIPNMPSGHISMQIGSKGPNLTLTTACAAGTAPTMVPMAEPRRKVGRPTGISSTACATLSWPVGRRPSSAPLGLPDSVR